MEYDIHQANVYRFLFRMTARAVDFNRDEFLNRLVTGLANRYGASACSIYRYGRKRQTAWAPTSEDIAGLERSDKAYLHNLDGRLVQHAMAKRALVSGLDLDVDGDVAEFLANQLPGTDIFAFPLLVDDGPRGAVVMYLPPGATSLNEADMQALMAIGEVLEVAEEQQERMRHGQERVRRAKAGGAKSNQAESSRGKASAGKKRAAS